METIGLQIEEASWQLHAKIYHFNYDKKDNALGGGNFRSVSLTCTPD
jgi:hypothetical protein